LKMEITNKHYDNNHFVEFMHQKKPGEQINVSIYSWDELE